LSFKDLRFLGEIGIWDFAHHWLMDEADERLFRSILNNQHHILHALLPPKSGSSQNYQFRRRVHDRLLPQHHGHLTDKKFVTICDYYIKTSINSQCIRLLFVLL